MECNEYIDNKVNESMAMIEVWKWKEEASKELLNMSSEERIENYKKITEQVARKYNIKFKRNKIKV